MTDSTEVWQRNLPVASGNFNTMHTFDGDGNPDRSFEINFSGGYISKEHVKAYMMPYGTSDYEYLDITFVNESTVRLSAAVPVGWVLTIYRDTPKDLPLASFTDGALITAASLDRNAEQAIFGVAEMVDRFTATQDNVDLSLTIANEAKNQSQTAIDVANEAASTAGSALRVPAGEAVNPTPNAQTRANKILAFNSGGQPVAVLPESGSAADVMLEYAKPTGASNIGAGEYKTQAQVNARRICVSDFGGLSGMAHDSSQAVEEFIAEINKGNPGVEFLVDGIYRVTRDMPTITKPVVLSGVIPANSAIVFDGVSNGLKIDLSGLQSNTVGSVVGHFAVLTNMPIAGIGFTYFGNSGSSQSCKLDLETLRVDSVDRFNGGRSECEWLCSVLLGKDEPAAGKPSEVRINNLVAYGSDKNATFSGLTGTGSTGVIANRATNCIITNSKIFLLDSWGVLFKGQSEGNGIYSSQVVSTRKGIAFADAVSPSNNHFMSNLHIAPYEVGISIKIKDGESPNSGTPLACFASNIFILERDEMVSKPAGFVGVDSESRFSKFENVVVWANGKAADTVTPKIAFKIANAGNTLSNCHSHRMSYAIETVDTIPGFAYGVALVEFLEEDSILGFIKPGSKLPAGTARTMKTAGRTWRRPLEYLNQMTLVHEGGVSMFDVNGGTVTNTPVSGTTTQYVHKLPGNTQAGAALIGLGGEAGLNEGVWVMRSSLVMFSGDIRPELGNIKHCGVSSSPWAGGFTQSAFTVTSDRRMKEGIRSIDSRLMDAIGSVDFSCYKFVDRVIAKGVDGARWHFGAIAQDIVQACELQGINALDYAFICYDEWETHVDSSGAVVPAGNRFGIRYEELLILEATRVRRELDEIKADIAELKRG